MQDFSRKDTIRIIAAVLGYLLVEGFLVLVLARKTGLPEMLFLVSTAGMVAAFVYGGPPTPIRALRVVVTVIACPIIVAVGLFALAPGVYTAWAIAILFPNSLMGKISAPFLVPITPIAFFFITRRFRHRNLQAEAEQWLLNRKRYGSVRMRRRSRIKRWSLWVPTLAVLGALLFWSPLQGGTSRLFNLSLGDVPGYRISVPLGWTPVWVYDRGGDYVTLLQFEGLGPATLMLTQNWQSVSMITLYSGTAASPGSTKRLMDRDREYAGEFQVRTLPAASRNLECWEYTRKSEWGRKPLLRATCTSDDGSFVARFYGNSLSLESFYKIVSSTNWHQ